MSKLDLSAADFNLAASAQLFYNPDGKHFSSKDFRAIVTHLQAKNILSKYSPTYKICGKAHSQIEDLKMYVLCFPFKKAVSFLPHTELKETRYAYFIMADFGKYIAISKKHITLPDLPCTKAWEPISRQQLSKAFTHSRSAIEHMSSTNLALGEHVVRKRSASANHLETALPFTPHHSHVVNEVTVYGSEPCADAEKPATRTKLSFTQSSIRQYGAGKTLNDFWEWAHQTVRALAASDTHESSPFFLNFAEEVGDIRSLGNERPSHVLLMWDTLLQLPELTVKLGSRDITNLFQKKAKAYTFLDTSSARHPIQAKYYSRCIKLEEKRLKRLHLHWAEDGGEQESTLQDYINREQCFMAVFADKNYRYYQGRIYQDSHLLNNVERFKKLFKAHKELKSVTSEKGPKNFPPKAPEKKKRIKNFRKGSIFHFVEKTFADDFDLFFCDDMGDELSDHIGLSPNKTAFYISKYAKKGGFSVSAVQEIIAQAQKNIPHFTPHEQLLEQKIAAFSNFWKGTGISKTRRNRYNYTTDEIKALWQSNMNTPGATKELHLVTNIITKAIVDKRLEQVSTPGSRISAAQWCYTLQFLWLLGALFNTCLEQGIQLTIHCR